MREVSCVFCDAVMEYQGEGMHFWRCPSCGTEVWPGEQDEEDVDIRSLYWEDVHKRPIYKRGHSSNSRGRGRQRPRVTTPLAYHYW